jgi:alkanesulfonate monooxygenase SsuD/methylene tetrahydromethanopterin reductase-like flavin-dependent oxidoreductase (luciferase family)
MARQRTRLVVGGPEKVKKRLLALVENTCADELMITTMVFDHGARKHSYEILAQVFGLTPRM